MYATQLGGYCRWMLGFKKVNISPPLGSALRMVSPLRTTCRICRSLCGLQMFNHWIATYICIPQISQNKGLTAKKKKELRNPRVKHRKKFYKAKIKRKSQVCCGNFLDRLSLHLIFFVTNVHSTREQLSAVKNREVFTLEGI